MREITLQELAALAENAKGEIRRIYLHWTAGHYNIIIVDRQIQSPAQNRYYPRQGF